jgi:phospholipid/cholesterol/gamma-HCH transport system permease protein
VRRQFSNFTGRLGRLILGLAARFGDQAGFGGRVLALARLGLARHPRLLLRLTLHEVFKIAYGALLLVVLVGFMLGWLWSRLWYGALANIGGLENMAVFLVDIHTVQIAPIMTAVIVVLRYSAPTTWELAILKPGHQLAAMHQMGLPPEPYLAVPRILGALMAVPALLAVFSLASFVGAYLPAWRISGQQAAEFLFSLSGQTSGGHFVVMAFKSAAIALSVSFFCVYNGFKIRNDGLELGPAAIRRAMGESFFYSVLSWVLLSVLYTSA